MANVTRKQLANHIVELLPTMSTSTLAKQIASYLITERRTKELNSLLRDVMQLRAERIGAVEADAVSTFPLSSSVKSEIKQLLSADKLILNETLDSSLLGGVRVESNDTLLDLSVRSRLSKLKSARTD